MHWNILSHLPLCATLEFEVRGDWGRILSYFYSNHLATCTIITVLHSYYINLKDLGSLDVKLEEQKLVS